MPCMPYTPGTAWAGRAAWWGSARPSTTRPRSALSFKKNGFDWFSVRVLCLPTQARASFQRAFNGARGQCLVRTVRVVGVRVPEHFHRSRRVKLYLGRQLNATHA